jgi:hypothetical protein
MKCNALMFRRTVFHIICMCGHLKCSEEVYLGFSVELHLLPSSLGNQRLNKRNTAYLKIWGWGEEQIHGYISASHGN